MPIDLGQFKKKEIIIEIQDGKKITPEDKKIPKESPKKAIKKVKEIEFKTDHLRTGTSLITGSSKRDKPPIIKQKLLQFLNEYEPIKNEEEKTWYWVKISK